MKDGDERSLVISFRWRGLIERRLHTAATGVGRQLLCAYNSSECGCDQIEQGMNEQRYQQTDNSHRNDDCPRLPMYRLPQHDEENRAASRGN